MYDSHRCFCFFFFQAEDGIRDLVRSRGLGDVYKRQVGAQVGRRALELAQAVGALHALEEADHAARIVAGALEDGDALSLIHI